MSACETCGGERTVIEFRRFAGEYMAGEPHEVRCPDCGGEGSWDDEPEEGDTGITLAELREKHGNPLTEVEDLPPRDGRARIAA